MFLPALRAFTLDDERDGVGAEPFGQVQVRQRDVFHAEGLLARLAVEVYVRVGEVAHPFVGA